jgi:hypothetical protein
MPLSNIELFQHHSDFSPLILWKINPKPVFHFKNVITFRFVAKQRVHIPGCLIMSDIVDFASYCYKKRSLNTVSVRFQLVLESNRAGVPAALKQDSSLKMTVFWVFTPCSLVEDESFFMLAAVRT